MSHANRSKKGPCRTPTVDEIRRLQKRMGWTNKECAERLCVTEHTWENWVREEGPNRREMPAGAWKLMRYEAGVLDPPGLPPPFDKVRIHRGNID